MVDKKVSFLRLRILTEMYQTINRLVTASRVWFYSYSISHVTQGKGCGWAPLGDVKIDLCLIASLH